MSPEKENIFTRILTLGRLYILIIPLASDGTVQKRQNNVDGSCAELWINGLDLGLVQEHCHVLRQDTDM